MFDYDYLSNITDDDCMVVQFVNEAGEPIGVAFQPWADLKEKNISDYVNKEVKGWWPKGVDGRGLDARKCKKLLKNDKDQWDASTMRILALGGRVDMIAQARSKELYGHLVLPKELRRQVQRKRLGSDSSAEEEGTPQDKNPTKKVKKCTKASKAHQNLNSEVLEVLDTCDRTPPFSFAMESEDEEDNDLLKASKGRLIDTIKILRQENNDLRKENSMLRKTIRTSDKIPKIESKARSAFDLLSKLEEHLQGISKKQTQQGISHSSSSISKKQVSAKENLHQSILQTTSLNKEVPKVNHVQKISTPPSTLLKESNKQQQDNATEEPRPEKQPDEAEQLQQSLNEPAAGEQDEATSSSDQQVSFGGRLVARSCLDKLKMKKTISKYTSGLCGAVFSPEELATSTITGKTANFHKGKATAKRKLAEEPLEALIAHVISVFQGGEKTDEELRAAAKDAVRVKCNNSAAPAKKPAAAAP